MDKQHHPYGDWQGNGVPYAAIAAPYQAYQNPCHDQQQQLPLFSADLVRETTQPNDFPHHKLPLARIKKIMKADKDVHMIAAEAPMVVARACELFILELTHRSWAHAEEKKRRTLQKDDMAVAISRTEVFDFLVDVVQSEEGKMDVDDALGAPPPADPRPLLPAEVAATATSH